MTRIDVARAGPVQFGRMQFYGLQGAVGFEAADRDHGLVPDLLCLMYLDVDVLTFIIR